MIKIGQTVALKSTVVRRMSDQKSAANFRAIVLEVNGPTATVQKIDNGTHLLYPIVKVHRSIPVANLATVKDCGLVAELA